MTDVNLRAKLFKTTNEYLKYLEDGELVIVDCKGLGTSMLDVPLKVYDPDKTNTEYVIQLLRNFEPYFTLTQPTTPQVGSTYLDTNDMILKQFDGNGWLVIAHVGALKPYWIENKDENYNIWTKINIPANSETIIYIRKTDGYQPDGDAVFEFFDNFEGSELNTNKWTLDEKTSTSVSNSILTIHHIGHRGWNTYIQTKDTIKLDKTTTKIKFRQIDTNTRVPDFRTLNGYGGTAGWSDGYDKHRAYFGGNSKAGSQYIGGSTNWEIFEFTILNDRTITKFRTETLTVTGTYHDEIIDNLMIGDGDDHGTDNDALQLDYIYVHKYTEQKPTVSVEQIDSNIWKVTVTNPNNYDLVDFQISINGMEIVNTEDESLMIIEC